jgi:hypothetical protein
VNDGKLSAGEHTHRDGRRQSMSATEFRMSSAADSLSRSRKCCTEAVMRWRPSESHP